MIYEFYCHYSNCGHKMEVSVPIDKISSYKPKKCPKHGVKLTRRYYAPHLANMSGGSTTSEKELLKKKQEYKKMRSRVHFKNTKLDKITDPHERRHFEKKFKGTKKMDHEKMK